MEGAQTIPAAGSHFVKTHNNFVLTIKPKGGYSLNNMVFSTGVEIRDKEGLQFASNSDGSVTITILAVTETLNLSISGISPENNEAINGDRVWVFGNRVHIRTQQPSNVQIYNALGQRYRDQNVPEGDSFIVLQRGFYTVVLNSKPYKVVVK